jgi:hypothetical protein
MYKLTWNNRILNRTETYADAVMLRDYWLTGTRDDVLKIRARIKKYKSTSVKINRALQEVKE